MTDMELQDQITELVDTMLAELKAADGYLDMAERWTDTTHQKTFVEFADTELYHYKTIRDIYDENKTTKYSSITKDNKVVERFMYGLCTWCMHLDKEIKEWKAKIGIN